jgi:hypothetical protein
MRRPSFITNGQLTDALRALGIDFIAGGDGNEDHLHEEYARLIAALADSEEARLRLSLIPLFLDHPELAGYALLALNALDPPAQLTLKCYYSAAVWLERKYQIKLDHLTDYFSKELNLSPANDPDENLRSLAKRHADLSGAQVNWLGTYQHAAQIWIREKHLHHD